MSDFEVHVVPRSSKPGPDGLHDGVPKLRVKSPPAEGRANAESERRLADLLGTPVRLVRGGRSRRKTFEVQLPAAELTQKIRDVFGT